MSNQPNPWTEVSDRLSALGLKLKLHAEEELSDESVKGASGIDKLVALVEQSFDAIGDAYKDDAVRDDVIEAGRALRSAIESTLRR